MSYDRTLFPERTAEYIALPVAASTTIAAMDFVAINSSGYAVPAADTAGYRVIGVSRAGADNSTGSAGAIKVNVKAFGMHNIEIAGVTVADLGKTVYVATATTGQVTANTNGIVIGQLVDIVESGALGAVRLLATQLDGATSPTALAAMTSATLTDNSGGTPAAGDTIDAITIPAATEQVSCGYALYENVTAPGTTGVMTQEDISAGGATFSGAGIAQSKVPRSLVVLLTDADDSVTDGTVTITGTGPDGAAVVEVFTSFPGDKTKYGSKIFAKITSIDGTGFAGNGAGDTVDVGWGSKLGVPASGTDFAVTKLTVAGTDEAASATDAVNFSFTPTTAPDGTKEFAVWFTYKAKMTAATVTVATQVRDDIAKVAEMLNKLTADVTAAETTLASLITNLKAAGLVG